MEVFLEDEMELTQVIDVDPQHIAALRGLGIAAPEITDQELLNVRSSIRFNEG